MKFEARKYQADAVDAWFSAIDSGIKCNPVIAVPTGAGKTVIMGLFIQKYLEKYPDNRVLVLSHTQEILEQDFNALSVFFPDKEIGIYSAGLGFKEVCQITVAGIQSIYKRPDLVAWVNLFIIDECHTVNHQSTGMYRSILDGHPGIVTGMSATVFRTGHGYIYKGTGLFDHLAHDLTSLDSFNKLVEDGYLTKLISVSPQMEMDVNDVKKSAGDYNVKALGNKFDRLVLTKQAIDEVIYYGHNYKKWLVFAIDTTHADNICDELKSRGVHAQVLHSKMNYDRAETIDNFKNGKVRALVSVGMVTTGFDAPNVDLIVLLRPTMSAVLHVQMIGRGLRIAPGKDHCLVLDFAGNLSRLGPINDIKVPSGKQQGKGKSEDSKPLMKKCPKCRALNVARASECEVCGHEFVFDSKLHTTASTSEVVAKGKKEPVTKWLDVDRVQYDVHKKAGKPDSLLVVYVCGVNTVKEWVCFDHTGYARDKAIRWAERRGYNGPMETHEVFFNHSTLKKPSKICVDYSDKYPSIKQSIIS